MKAQLSTPPLVLGRYMVFRIPANATTMIEIPQGLPYTYLSFAVTANPNPQDNTAPAAGVNVRFLVG